MARIRSRIKISKRPSLSEADPAQRHLPRKFPKYVANEPGPVKRTPKRSYK